MFVIRAITYIIQRYNPYDHERDNRKRWLE